MLRRYLPPKATLSFHTLKPWAKKTTWVIKDTTWVIEDGAAIPRPSFLVHSKLSQLLKIAMLTHPEHNTLTTTSLECHPPYTQAVVPSLYTVADPKGGLGGLQPPLMS